MAICNEEGCQVLMTGKCINNLQIDNCPHYSDVKGFDNNSQLEFDEDKDVVIGKIEVNKNVIDVYSGKALNLTEVNRISKSSLTRLVILAGLPDAGKTTMLLSLMHLFQTNTSFEGFLFAGSETLLDFEEKSHPSKIASEKLDDDTNRTPIGPPTFLHLKVAQQTDVNNTIDLLFTDISGELFIALKDSSQDAKKFIICQRADHFALFFDSDRITTLKERANARTSGLGIIRSLNESGTLLPHTHIQVIFSRWDLFKNKGDQKIHNQFIDLLKTDISSQFGKLYDITFFEVSARPKSGTLPFGFGINKIFPLWVTKSILDGNTLHETSSNENNLTREFSQYKFNN
ncbi:hypothetical protein [Pedobacter sp. L105]|uniref:TRAFAC clade GTPase domain-containing protein n=1 Tax=Pedobacter sp. L105 TaxID=1641871 RepID=UPI00131E3815|nr:hypothetical protein [Pedobacter sp. L105]